ncbi:MAG: uroporphyrinogen decarboxylase [Deltaproteobacteria bacterium]|nr:uroporphyrinogen decarboxylase [Deltaproteobacteria bacterium]
MSLKKVLLERTFGLEETSRIPVGFWFHLIPEAETGDALKDPSLPSKSVAAHKAFIAAAGPDFVKTMSDGFFFYPFEGAADSPGGLEGLRPIPASHPWIVGQAGLQREVRACDPLLPYFYNVFSPLTSLRFLVGREKLLSFLREAPAAVEEALNRIGDGLSVLAREVIARGMADGIYLSVQNPDSASISAKDYLSRIAPSEIRILEAASAAGGRSILHVCGYAGARNRLRDFASYPASAVSFARTVEGVGFPEAREIFAGRALIAGFPNTPGSVLHKGTRAEVEAYTEDLLKEAAGLRGIIIGADCTVPSDIGIERFAWVREAANRKGQA